MNSKENNRSEYQANKMLQPVDRQNQTGTQWIKPATNAARFKKANWFVRLISFLF